MTTKKKTSNKGILLDDNVNQAMQLIKKIEEASDSANWLTSAFVNLEMGDFDTDILQDLLDNAGKNTMDRYRDKIRDEVKAVPSKTLRDFAMKGGMKKAEEFIEMFATHNVNYGEYLKYLSFKDGKFFLSEETKEEIFESVKEYESLQAAELRKKHQAALNSLNDFLLHLKSLKPDYIFTNYVLSAVFDLNEGPSKDKQPFALREVNYQLIAEERVRFEKLEFDRKVERTVNQLRQVFNDTGDSSRVLSEVQKLKEGGEEEKRIASSEDMAYFLETFSEPIKLETVPTVKSANTRFK